MTNLSVISTLMTTHAITLNNAIGDKFKNIFENQVYQTIKDIAGPIAIVVLACAGLAWWFGKGVDSAKKWALGACGGLMIVYLAPTIIETFVGILG